MAGTSQGLAPVGAVAGDLLKAAAIGRMHEATASAAAAAMNAAAPPRSVPGGRGVDNIGEFGHHFGGGPEPSKVISLELSTDVGAEDGTSSSASASPMKIPVGSEKRSSGPSEFRAAAAEFVPTNKAKAAQKEHEPKGGQHLLQIPQQQDYLSGMGHMNPSAAVLGANPQYPMFNPYMLSLGMSPLPFGYPPISPMPIDPYMTMANGGMPYMPRPMYPTVGGMVAPTGPSAPHVSISAGNQKKPGKTKSGERRRTGKAKGTRAASPTTADKDDAANLIRSAALTEVRKQGGKDPHISLTDVLPHVIEFAMDQHGSRFLQNKLDEATDPERVLVFEEIVPETKKLAGDVFGNFVIQKLFECGTQEQKRRLADQLQNEVQNLAKETYGCRVIQKALQLLPRDSQMKLAEELIPVVPLIDNMHGNHVIQKCIEQMPPDSVTFIIDAVTDRVETVASHVYGCRVVQRLLEHCAPHQLQQMREQILECVAKLAQDPYGNYVVQHMLEHGRKEDKKKIIGVISSKVVYYAKNKCSSNVVEKCFEVAAIGEHCGYLEEDRQQLFKAVLGQPNDPESPLKQLMDDRFGNYIVQRMIEYSRGPDREMLKLQLQHAEPLLRSTTNGKHIQTAFEKEFNRR